MAIGRKPRQMLAFDAVNGDSEGDRELLHWFLITVPKAHLPALTAILKPRGSLARLNQGLVDALCSWAGTFSKSVAQKIRQELTPWVGKNHRLRILEWDPKRDSRP